jgi:uncharacterized membrane protein
MVVMVMVVLVLVVMVVVRRMNHKQKEGRDSAKAKVSDRDDVTDLRPQPVV